MPNEPPTSLVITLTFASGMLRWREKMSCIMCGACVAWYTVSECSAAL